MIEKPNPNRRSRADGRGFALDRYHLYQRHVLEAMQFIFSLQAVRSNAPPAAPLYKMQLMLDGMIVLSNPNDVRLRFPPGLIRYVDLQGIPYDAKLKVLKVGDYIITAQNPKPKPIMLFSIIRNVERNSGGANPDALPSRPIQLGDPALGNVPLFPSTIRDDLHKTQMMFAAKPLNFQFETFAAGAGGRNVYQGGGRQPSVGGDFTAIKRRIPLAPPLSLGAFENAIAGGFWAHYGDPAFPGAWNTIGAGVDPTKTGLNSSLSNGTFGYPFLAKAIGNSFTHPFVASGSVHRPGTGSGTRNRAATDPSWMVNTALWDSWFLSGIVDGTGTAAANPMKDLRTSREQFRDLAEGTGMLRNTRYRFHSHKSPQEALDELFTGDDFKGSALNSLGKYLLIDGAFNPKSEVR